MASRRAGMLFDAVSSGLDLFIGREAQKEKDRIDREWDMTLARIRREDMAADRAARFEHAETMAATAAESADRRHTENLQARADENAANRAARASELKEARGIEESRFARKRADDARSALNKTLLDLQKQMSGELEENSFDPARQQDILRRYQDLKDQAILGTVSWASGQGLPGFEAKDEQGLSSLLMQSGMDQAGASDYAKQIWPQIDPSQILIPQSLKSRRDMASSHLNFLSDPAILDLGMEGGGTSAASPTPAPTTRPTDPTVVPPSAGGGDLFENERPYGLRMADKIDGFLNWMKEQGQPLDRR